MSTGTACVLIVDDEADVRDTLRDVIELGGCRAAAAANGAEAMRMLGELRPCLIILDLRMPVMNGKQMLAALQREPDLAKLPVVISTSAPESAPPGLPVLPKPIDIAKLWGFMQRYCGCTPPKL